MVLSLFICKADTSLYCLSPWSCSRGPVSSVSPAQSTELEARRGWDSNLWILVNDMTQSWDSALRFSLSFKALTITNRFHFSVPAAVSPVNCLTSQHCKELWAMLSHVFLLCLHHPDKQQYCSHRCSYPTATSLSWFLSFVESRYIQRDNKLGLQISTPPVNCWSCYPGSGHHFSLTAH